MKPSSVAMHCPVCDAPAELRAVLTDMGFAVARAALAIHLSEAHQLDPDDAADQVEALPWEARAVDA